MYILRFAAKYFLRAIIFIIILKQCSYPIHHILVKHLQNEGVSAPLTNDAFYSL